jgi:hypothetical protein
MITYTSIIEKKKKLTQFLDMLTESITSFPPPIEDIEVKE